MEEYQRLLKALQSYDSRQLADLRQFIIFRMALKRLSCQDLQNLLNEIDDRMGEKIEIDIQEQKNDVSGIEIEI